MILIMAVITLSVINHMIVMIFDPVALVTQRVLR